MGKKRGGKLRLRPPLIRNTCWLLAGKTTKKEGSWEKASSDLKCNRLSVVGKGGEKDREGGKRGT